MTKTKSTVIAQEIDELRQLSTKDLAARYEELHGKAPHVRHREFLWRRCIWKLQECHHGGLSALAQRRLEELIAEIDLPADEQQRTVTGRLHSTRKSRDLKPGTTLVRTWKGREYRATVGENGIELDGTVHRSLTAAAKAVTGAHWNGKLFWGLTERRKAQ